MCQCGVESVDTVVVEHPFSAIFRAKLYFYIGKWWHLNFESYEFIKQFYILSRLIFRLVVDTAGRTIVIHQQILQHCFKNRLIII
jgi:hypothetical protein